MLLSINCADFQLNRAALIQLCVLCVNRQTQTQRRFPNDRLIEAYKVFVDRSNRYSVVIVRRDLFGLQLHRSIADMMRYAALNQGADNLASYSGFIPGTRDFRTLPDPSKLLRNSDEQLYALSLYIYSLKPPPNPNKPDRLVARGQKIFEREGCAGCHTPPLYTSNSLVAVDEFEVPREHRQMYDILWASVGTDSRLATQTRRGTGYYKVPSLKECGIAGRSSTTDPWQLWKTGSIHAVYRMIMYRQDSKALVL